MNTTALRVLGVETSCDETALALVDYTPAGARLLGEALATQAPVHALFGGVVPEIASREHLRLLPQLFERLLQQTGISPASIQGVAVARGPGLLGALLSGVSFAKGVALGLDTPLIGVNHLEAHLLAAGLDGALALPALGLLVSGGHTELIRLEPDPQGGAYPIFTQLGRTLDDAAGEAFDKCAKALNLPYPGGACLDRLAALASDADTAAGPFSPPYVENDNLDFSFSGLKTAATVAIQKRPALRRSAPRTMQQALEDGRAEPELARFCQSFNRAVAQALEIKTRRALERQPAVRSLILAGGVAANSMVRERLAALAQERQLGFTAPRPDLCTDNAAMVAYAGALLLASGCHHGLDLEAIPRGRAVPRDYSRHGKADIHAM
ncbi:tRNA (adenosine(37)-N6)-threonylcarbamoyltransferase complex transferase subunit TsaD [Megalodesulfovibrio paquesii]